MESNNGKKMKSNNGKKMESNNGKKMESNDGKKTIVVWIILILMIIAYFHLIKQFFTHSYFSLAVLVCAFFLSFTILVFLTNKSSKEMEMDTAEKILSWSFAALMSIVISLFILMIYNSLSLPGHIVIDFITFIFTIIACLILIPLCARLKSKNEHLQNVFTIIMNYIYGVALINILMFYFWLDGVDISRYLDNINVENYTLIIPFLISGLSYVYYNWVTNDKDNHKK